jgi:T4 RnlA family RNA ligase
MSNHIFFFPFLLKSFVITIRHEITTLKIISTAVLSASFLIVVMATPSVMISMVTLYDDLMNLCSQDDVFYYNDIRLKSIDYRIFNCRLCSYGRFKTGTAALNCCGTMFNITNPRNLQLVSLPLEKIFDYEEGFGQKQFHQRGQLGDKMEKMDGSLMSTFLHGRVLREQTLQLKSKQSLTSHQVLAATRLLLGIPIT